MVKPPLQHWGATGAEIASVMPGDELIAGDAVEGTRAVTIVAGSDVVFGFVAQMGFGKAGWYSYDLVDNLGRSSATTVHPDWVIDRAGALVPGGPIDFVAAIVERPTAYVLQVPTKAAAKHRLDFTLAYRLDPTEVGTRLVSRVRIRVDGVLGSSVAWGLLAGDGVMVRKQLDGIRRRAEAI